MMTTLTHHPAPQRPPSSPSPTLPPWCALNSNALLFLQRFLRISFPGPAILLITTLFDDPNTALLSHIPLPG